MIFSKNHFACSCLCDQLCLHLYWDEWGINLQKQILLPVKAWAPGPAMGTILIHLIWEIHFSIQLSKYLICRDCLDAGIKKISHCSWSHHCPFREAGGQQRLDPKERLGSKSRCSMRTQSPILQMLYMCQGPHMCWAPFSVMEIQRRMSFVTSAFILVER